MTPLLSPERRHFAVKFAAGALRVAAVLILIAGTFGAFAVTRGQVPGANTPFPVDAGGLAIVFVLFFTLVYAVIVWGFADALILLADSYDAQRITQQQVAVLLRDRMQRPVDTPPAS